LSLQVTRWRGKESQQQHLMKPKNFHNLSKGS
jgi:hypothetical protein